jgi:exosome complex RNA-binding protein Rrp42 (RNase PH superfamily)
LDYGGNLLDTIFVATRGALQNALIPKATVEEAAGHYEFDVSDEETETLKGWEDVPIVTTLYKVHKNASIWTPLHFPVAYRELTLQPQPTRRLALVTLSTQHH